jgi:hypothetical protein
MLVSMFYIFCELDRRTVQEFQENTVRSVKPLELTDNRLIH